MSAPDEESFERMVALEALVFSRLDTITRDATLLLKTATKVETATEAMRGAVASIVTDALVEVRKTANERFVAETGIFVGASGTDDVARGTTASDAYVKTWTKAFEKSEGVWTLALEEAREAGTVSLERIACYEVCLAWNDERRLNARAAKKVGRWATVHDRDVCKACKALDGKAEDKNGKFPGGVGHPPLHVLCRCSVNYDKSFDDAGDEPMSSIATNGLPPTARKDAFQSALAAVGGIVRKDDALRVKAIREGTREVDFVASTGTLDCHYEIIDQESWQLDDYLANPVVLYGHNAWDLPIGQCSYVAVRNGQLECTIKFASAEANPEAEKVWKLVLEKVLRAVSVGFRPVNGGYEVRDGDDVWVWRNALLKEISVVAIPANPEALAKMKAATPPALGGTNPLAGSSANVTQPHAGVPGTSTKGHDIMKTVEQLTKELEDKTAAHSETVSKLGAVNVKLVEAEARAEKADAGRSVAEKALGDVTAKVSSLEAAAKTLETEHTKACTDRDAATKKAGELEDKLIELEVEGIVGKKIAPTEKAEFVELRKSNEKLFKSMVEKRPDMALETRVTASDAAVNAKGETTLNGTPSNAGATASASFNEL